MGDRLEDGPERLGADGDVEEVDGEEEAVVLAEQGHQQVADQVEEGEIAEDHPDLPQPVLCVYAGPSVILSINSTFKKYLIIINLLCA